MHELPIDLGALIFTHWFPWATALLGRAEEKPKNATAIAINLIIPLSILKLVCRFSPYNAPGGKVYPNERRLGPEPSA